VFQASPALRNASSRKPLSPVCTNTLRGSPREGPKLGKSKLGRPRASSDATTSLRKGKLSVRWELAKEEAEQKQQADIQARRATYMDCFDASSPACFKEKKQTHQRAIEKVRDDVEASTPKQLDRKRKGTPHPGARVSTRAWKRSDQPIEMEMADMSLTSHKRQRLSFSSISEVPGSEDGTEDIAKKLSAIYEQHNPAKVSEIPRLLKKYEGRGAELVAAVEKKYIGNAGGSAAPVAMQQSAFAKALMRDQELQATDSATYVWDCVTCTSTNMGDEWKCNTCDTSSAGFWTNVFALNGSKAKGNGSKKKR
jgi:hypothetical protein